MGVPGFYSWIIRRYPMAKQMVDRYQLPEIDYLYLDMNGIIYKCVKDESLIFKQQLLPKQLDQIWIGVFNYINMIVNLLKPNKMIFMALDGVAPRSKMNNQRSRRFRSSRDYSSFMQYFQGFKGDRKISQENFKNNSISPGTIFMHDLNQKIEFFIKKKIQQDDYWKQLSILFTGSNNPGQGEHKIMEFIRSNQSNFNSNDSHCFYGADADLIMLALILPMHNICIIRQEYIHLVNNTRIANIRQTKKINFQMIFISIIRQYFDIQYKKIKNQMCITYDINKIIKDFVFTFFFIGNDFLPRCMACNIRQDCIQYLITAFKNFLKNTDNYLISENQFNLKSLGKLLNFISAYQPKFIQSKLIEVSQQNKKLNNFQNQFTNQIKYNMQKQQNFLLQIKHLYANQVNNARRFFYQQKFKIDILNQMNQFNQILISYFQGLKFVFDYYYINLSSWCWYYPYYYAPFLSDLAVFINCKASQQRLPQLELGNPFKPFKQLLCIMPKQSSQLLPQSFQQYISSQKSPLRTPIDYFPDKFVDDAYGSNRSFQAISLIPFLDLKLIQLVYNEAILKINPNELPRNQFRPSKMFQYQTQAEPIYVQSPIQLIKSFQCKINIVQINLRTKLKLGFQEIIKEQENKFINKMPTLEMKHFQAQHVQINKKTLNQTILVTVNQSEPEDIKLGEQVFYNYPIEHSGRIQCFLSLQQFRSTQQFKFKQYYMTYKNPDFQNYEYLKKNYKIAYQDIKRNLSFKYRHLNFDLVKTFAFIVVTSSFTRTLSGGFERLYKDNYPQSYQIIPKCLISKNRYYETTKNHKLSPKIQNEFYLNESVLIVSKNKKNLGFHATIVGYSKDKKKLKINKILKLKRIPQKLLCRFANTDEVFFTLRFVAEIVNLRSDLLLELLKSIIILVPVDHTNSPGTIDIGLNFIGYRNNEFVLVPNLVRINFKNKQNSQDPFRQLQISLRAVQIIIQYKNKYPQILQFILYRHTELINQAKQKSQKIDWKKKIKLEDIYNNQSKLNSLMNVYFWLLQKQQTHLPLSSIYSKQISAKKILKFQNYFKDQMQKQKNQKIIPQQVDIQIDPNFLFSLNLAKKGYLYLSQKPKNHTIGDQVICVKQEFFGHYGIIVGVNDFLYQVLFSRPSFGKNNLGGLCSNLWGGKFQFRELMNFDTWPQLFRIRQYRNSIIDNIGWDQSEQYLYPQFKSKPLQNFRDFDMIVQLNKSTIKKETIDFINQVRKNLNQIEINKEYHVVDNKKKDYMYKYDNKETTITEEQCKIFQKTNQIQKSIKKEQIDHQKNKKNFNPNTQVEQKIHQQNDDKPLNKSSMQKLIKSNTKIKYQEKKDNEKSQSKECFDELGQK